MRIEVIKQIDTETREVWAFNMFDLNAVFVWWSRESKPKRKRNWIIEEFWDNYGYGREKFRMAQEPILPEVIRNEALLEVMKHIKVHTWNEWKKM